MPEGILMARHGNRLLGDCAPFCLPIFAAAKMGRFFARWQKMRWQKAGAFRPW